jgi:NADPH:quinone reductase-like Zn-dependent oxidoreductase
MTGLILAKAAGAVTIVTSSSDDKLDFVKKEYGADYTINYKKTPNWAEGALKITGGRGVDIIFDNAGGSGIQQSLDAVAYGGIIACIGFLNSDSSNMPDVGLGALLKGCVVRGILVGSKQLLDDLVTFVVNKKLAIPISKSFGFSREEVISAYKHLQSGDHIGKVGIVVD